MLHLILGPSGTGKSTLLMNEIRRRAEAGQASILLVPEQFTSSTEGRIYRELGDGLSAWVSSYSFSSLAEKLLDEYGGAAVRTVTDAARVVLVRRAVEALGPRVTYYGRHRRSPVFLQKCAETLNELKSAGLTGPQLERLSVGPGREKLAELAAIYAAYEALLQGTAMDPGDRVEVAAQKAAEHPEFFCGRAVFVDEFDTFDSAKQALLRAMLAVSDVTVTLCADGLTDHEGGMGLFSGAKQVAARLLRLAAQAGCRADAHRVLTEDLRHQNAPGLAALGRALTGEEAPAVWPGVTLYKAPDREDEVRAVAAAIQKLARQGVCYREMAVICRESGDYLRLVRTEFARANIPLFVDEATTAQLAPPAQLVRGLLGVLRGGLTTERVLAVAKTGLCGLSEQQLCALENYAFTWTLTAANWRAPFDRNPSGFGGGPLRAEEQQQLELAEAARARLIPRLDELLKQAKGLDAPALTKCLYQTMENLDAGRADFALAKQLEAAGRLAESAETLRLWNVTMNVLDQMAVLFEGETLEAAEYDEMLTLLLRSTDLGHIPQTLDAVIFTSAGKMRLDRPDYCFVMGLAEGEFPRAPGDTGLLTHADRDELLRMAAALPEEERFELPDRFENRVIRENVSFYKALTAAGRGLWLSWAEGAGGLPVTSALPLPPEGLPAPPLTEADRCLTPEMALDRLGEVWQQQSPLRATLKQALEEREGPLLARMEQAGREADFHVERPAAAEALLGKELRLSASQLRSFCQCQFAYYMEYVLRIKPQKPARMDPAQGGTMIHYILEKALQEPDFYDLDEPGLERLAARLAARFVEENIPEPGAQLRYLAARMARSAGKLLWFLQQDLLLDPYEPTAFELGIGEQAGQVPPLTFPVDGEHAVKVIGKIDRVDVQNGPTGAADRLRVVDYKTGTKKFSLTDVLTGEECQMLLYLFTLTARWPLLKGHAGEFQEVEYLMVDPAPKDEGRAKAMKEGGGLVYEKQGMILEREGEEEPPLPPEKQAAMAKASATESQQEAWRKGNHRVTLHRKQLENIEAYLQELIVSMAKRLYAGQITACPRQNKQGTTGCKAWCPYRSVCGHVDGEHERERPEEKKDLFMEKENVEWDN